MKSHTDVIDLWPNVTELAKDLGFPGPGRVIAWRRRGVVPARYFDRIIALLQRRGFPPVTYAQLTEWGRTPKGTPDA